MHEAEGTHALVMRVKVAGMGGMVMPPVLVRPVLMIPVIVRCVSASCPGVRMVAVPMAMVAGMTLSHRFA